MERESGSSIMAEGGLGGAPPTGNIRLSISRYLVLINGAIMATRRGQGNEKKKKNLRSVSSKISKLSVSVVSFFMRRFKVTDVSSNEFVSAFKIAEYAARCILL
jgi:hypothetical protein